MKVDTLRQRIKDFGMEEASKAMILDMADELLEVYQAAEHMYQMAKAFKNGQVTTDKIALAKKAIEKIFRDKDK